MNPILPQAALPVRLLILSDLHLEFGPFTPPGPEQFDLVVLAGDIGTGGQGLRWAQREACFAGKPVLYVPGNHEFYGHERRAMLSRLRQRASGSPVHLLDRNEVRLHSIRFLGTTLWTDFALQEAQGHSVEQAMQHALARLSDFNGRIRERRPDGSGTEPFSPHDALREHQFSRVWLRRKLSGAPEVDADSDPLRGDMALPTVLITHHAPCRRSLHPAYAGDPINPAYYSELPAECFHGVTLWIHGHSHRSADYRHHTTRVLANPRGYVNSAGSPENPDFQPDRVVSVTGAGHA